MSALSALYRPITATPFQDDDTYCEILPCEALRPYIRCFWGTKRPLRPDGTDSAGLVIPDTCMDIIFDINYTQNRCKGIFCAIDEHSYRSRGAAGTDCAATFAIRFYAWSAMLFAERDFKGTKNQYFSVGEFYRSLEKELAPMLFDAASLQEKIRIAEAVLLRRLNEIRMDSALMNAIYHMLHTNGRAKISDICGYAAVSEKQLERLFDHHMGIAPKAFSSLLRYQLLWQDIALSGRFDALDAVEKFGYYDQPHLLRDFKKHHLLNIRDALEFASVTR